MVRYIGPLNIGAFHYKKTTWYPAEMRQLTYTVLEKTVVSLNLFPYILATWPLENEHRYNINEYRQQPDIHERTSDSQNPNIYIYIYIYIYWEREKQQKAERQIIKVSPIKK